MTPHIQLISTDFDGTLHAEFEDPPVPLDLQALIEATYALGRYDTLDYTQELDPPLTPDEAAWAKSLLKTAGRN